MFRRKASVVGWPGLMRTSGCQARRSRPAARSDQRRSKITESGSVSIVDHMDTTSASSRRMKHPDGITEIALTIDNSNIDLFSEKHVQALKDVTRLAAEMTAATKEVKRRRNQQVYGNK
ncbi:hypothetical protein BGZ59_001662 [Podila verticillata]|nr:hypothetical protein BGZ59_001662 [Podila verticillata]